MTNQANELETTLAQLARMRRAMAALHAERPRYSEAWFAVMSEGPLEELHRLEAQVDALSGRAGPSGAG